MRFKNILLKNNYINIAIVAMVFYCVFSLLEPKQKETKNPIIQPIIVQEIEPLKLPQSEIKQEQVKQEQAKQQEVKQATTKKVIEVNKYSPRWNVEGSMKKAENKADLIKHLSGNNHGYSVDYLNQLSVDDLQMLHDSDHDSRKNTTYTRPRFRLFRR